MVVLIQFLSIVISWFLAQIIKFFLGYTSFSKEIFFSSGGMPSSHTAASSAFLFSELFFHGLTSLSVLALLVTIVIAVDAVGVRQATGVNAKVLLNSIKDKKLKKQIKIKNGHTISQVVVGFLLGLITAGILFVLV